MKYKYTILKQDGTTQELPVSAKKSLKDFYKILNCSIVEIIPQAYFAGRNYGKCTMWGDEEGRYKESNIRNPHFNVLQGNIIIGEPAEWDVVGDIIKEEIYKEENI